MLSHRACADSVLLVCVITVFSGSLCGQEMDAEEVVEMIGRNERLMRNIQCRFRWLEAETGLVYRDSEWGYESGKEFVAGTWHAKTEDGEILPYTGVNAFDGKVVRSYTYVPSSGDVRGGVYGYDPHVFSVGTSPKTLLGYTLDQDGIYTLSELLSDEYVLNKSARLEPLEGRECIVLEVTGFRVRAHAPMYDVRIWIDPKRNYRPLQIDKYDSADDKESLAGLRGERWKYLSRSVHGIELREVEGIWFPVCGEEAFYEIQPEFIAKGGTEEEFRKRHAGTSDEELAKTVNLVTVPMGTKHRV